MGDLRQRFNEPAPVITAAVHLPVRDIAGHVRRLPFGDGGFDEWERVSAAHGEGTIGSTEAMVRMAALCFCESDGTPVFDYTDDKDLALLRREDADDLRVMFDAGVAVNKTDDDEPSETENEAAKSDAAPVSGSGSA